MGLCDSSSLGVAWVGVSVCWVDGAIGQFWDMSDVEPSLQQSSSDSNPAPPQGSCVTMGKASLLPQVGLPIAQVPSALNIILRSLLHNTQRPALKHLTVSSVHAVRYAS